MQNEGKWKKKYYAQKKELKHLYKAIHKNNKEHCRINKLNKKLDKLEQQIDNHVCFLEFILRKIN
jgi:hypothetical protein